MSKQVASNYKLFWHDETLASFLLKTLNRASVHVVGNVRERGKRKNALEKVRFVIRGGSLSY